MRIRCWLWGCMLDGEQYAPPECVRCGAELYDRQFVQEGKLPGLWFLLTGRIPRLNVRCDQCKRLMWPRQNPCCSEECEDEWIPF